MFPLPYLLFFVALACGASFAGGWHYGSKVEKTALATYKVEVASAEAQWRTKIGVADARADKAEAALKAERAKKQKAIIEQVIVHAQNLPDPPECALDPVRVSVINAAVDNTNSADTGDKAPAVPEPAQAGRGISLSGGVLGGTGSWNLWGLRGSASKSD